MLSPNASVIHCCGIAYELVVEHMEVLVTLIVTRVNFALLYVSHGVLVPKLEPNIVDYYVGVFFTFVSLYENITLFMVNAY